MTSDHAVDPNDVPAPPAGNEPSSTEGENQGKKPATVKPVKPVKQQGGGVVPMTAAEDDPRTWGDSESDNDHDAWLKEQKPPHWG